MKSKVKKVGLLLMSMVLVMSCGKDDDEPSVVSVSSITLSETSITLAEGGSRQLTAAILPKDADNKSVTWNSSDASVATVDAKGLVTGVKAGKATVTATTKDGGKTAKCEVTVTATAVKVTLVKLDKTELTLEKSKTEQLTATVTPENATDKSVTWKSSDASVATVDAKGLVTGVKAGKATVTVTTKDGGKTAKCEVTVTAGSIPSTDAKITMTTAKSIGEKIKLYINAEAADHAGVWIDLNNNGKKENGEAVTTFGKDMEYTLGAKTITLYGEVTYLDCDDNQLTALDVSKNTQLQRLLCYANPLTALDISKNTQLQRLDCSFNQLTALDVSKNTQLQSLECSFNPLTALDVSKNTQLQTLYCVGNQLTALDVSKNTQLQRLACSNNQLTALDVSKNTQLLSLGCSNNPLTALDISKNTQLQRLGCKGNPELTKLNVANGNNKNFKNPWSDSPAFDATGCPKLKCIKVDKGFNPTGLTGKKEWKKDAGASWRNDGSDCP